jgi:hypothetical protein
LLYLSHTNHIAFTVITMNKLQLLSAQIAYFNEQLKKDLTDEQIADVADYFYINDKDLFNGLRELVAGIATYNFKGIKSNYGICSELSHISRNGFRIDAYSIIGMLSHYFYSDYAYKNYLDLSAKRIHYPIPSKTHYEELDNQWVGVLLTRRLAYIKWLVRQFNLMIKHLES